jgi:hypothetical protein
MMEPRSPYSAAVLVDRFKVSSLHVHVRLDDVSVALLIFLT